MIQYNLPRQTFFITSRDFNKTHQTSNKGIIDIEIAYLNGTKADGDNFPSLS